MDNGGFVLAGYLLTALVFAAYVASLFYRSRKARRMARALASRRG